MSLADNLETMNDEIRRLRAERDVAVARAERWKADADRLAEFIVNNIALLPPEVIDNGALDAHDALVTEGRGEAMNSCVQPHASAGTPHGIASPDSSSWSRQQSRLQEDDEDAHDALASERDQRPETDA